MKRLGKLVIMTDHEHYCLMTRLEMANGYRDVAVADLRKAEAARDNAIAVARRFHAAGGYSHTLPKVKEQLSHATESLAHCIDLLVKWRPLVASLETMPGQFVDRQFDTKVSVTRELCGIDKEWKKLDMTREEFDSLYQGHFKPVPIEAKARYRGTERPEQTLIDLYLETGKTLEEREAERRRA